MKHTFMSSTSLTPFDHDTECKGLGKILGLVIGVVAAIAVPFLAPIIGGALGGGFFASVAGQALIGAGIGAAGGALGAGVSGGDILKGALIGGAGGALAGGGGALFRGAGLTTGPATAGGIPTIDPLTGFENANAPIAGAAAGASGALAGATGSDTLVGATGADTLAGATAAGAAPAAAPGILSGVSTGFKTAALQSLLNGGVQMLQTLMPSQQAELFKQMQAEMAVTRTQDMAAYTAQKKIFDEYYNFAKGINPEFFSQLERSNEQQRLSSTWQETERSLRGAGYSTAAIEAERRKMEVGAAAGLNTAGTSGFLRGMDAQGRAFQTASSLYPQTPTGNLQNLNYLHSLAGDSERDRAGGIAGLASPWAIYLQNRVEGMPNSKKQDRIAP